MIFSYTSLENKVKTDKGPSIYMVTKLRSTPVEDLLIMLLGGHVIL